jgi:hypothetical protein
MNRRIGRLVQIGLFAALPVGWTATALAQNTAGSNVSGDTGINPLPSDNSLTKDQKKAGDIDQNLGNPGSNVGDKDLSLGNKSDTMGTSGSSGSVEGNKANQSGSQMSGSSGAVPGSVDTKDIEKSSGSDVDKSIEQKTEINKTKKSVIKKQINTTSPDTSDFGSTRSNDSNRLDDSNLNDSSNLNK